MVFYLDTSIFGGLFDEEFEEYTKALFEYINKESIEVIYSEVLEGELEEAPRRVKAMTDKIKRIIYVKPRKSALELADLYIKEGALTEKSKNDAQHIATATVEGASVIVSWNFKHMVNFLKIQQYNSINLRQGYRIISIHTPIEIITR
ncbi:MAG: PIN domain-containing protein [Cytophagales bacterium]|nr:PIN domain-containing protein [Cytophagales bacterium]